MSFTDGSDQANAKFQETISALQKLVSDTEQPGQSSNTDTLLDSRLSAMLVSKDTGVIRTPWIMSTTEWLSSNPSKGIVLATNPTDASWTLSQRMSITKNLGGTVTHAWPNVTRTTYYDEPRVTLSMQSGSLIPVAMGTTRSLLTTYNNGAPSTSGSLTVNKWVPSPGITSFYAFLQLLDQPVLTKDGRANLVSIQYASNLFPSLTLLGRFDPKGVTFSDSSQDPNKVSSWSAEFIVYDSSPRLSDNLGLGTTREDLLKKYMAARIDNNPNLPKG